VYFCKTKYGIAKNANSTNYTIRMPIILAIESSCDDTSAAVLRDDRLLSNVIASQKVHEQFGGVVPELASRAHLQNIVPVVDTAIKNAKIEKCDIDAVAFTRGPGLLGSLLVGVSFAKSFAQALGVPLIEVNHLQAHVLSHFIKSDDRSVTPQFPFLCLLVSGGHTQIILLHSHFEMEILGQTIDDAAGEAIDKAAKIMDLGYPGGTSSTGWPRRATPTLSASPHPTSQATTTASVASRHRSYTSCATGWSTTPTLSRRTRPTSAPRYRNVSWASCSRSLRKRP